MASIFRQRYTRNGVTKQSKRWYIEYKGADGKPKRVAAYADKAATRQLAARLEREASHKSEGLIDKYAEHLVRPLAEHIADWEAGMIAKGNTASYAKLSANRVRAVFTACRFRRWPDISASKVTTYLADLRSGTVPTMRSGKYKDRNPRRSVESTNHYLKSAKGFCAWCVRDGRAHESPIAHLKRGNANTDRRHDRRALLADEIRRLIVAAEFGPKRFGIEGVDRAMLYRVAYETGLRSSELRSLTAGSFDLDGDPPTVRVAAAFSKHRREDVLPLRRSFVVDLRSYLSRKLLTARAFAMPSVSNVVRMLRADLEDAGIVYRDDAGRFADFHSLRHSFISALARGGVHPRVAQSLARHSTITLTMNTYTHVLVGDQTVALDALADLSVGTRTATGTDPK